MKRRSIREGSRNYLPKYSKIPRFTSDDVYFRLRVLFDVIGYYSPTQDGPLGKDGKDINKLGGITSFDPLHPLTTWKQNSCAVMVGFNPNEKKGYWNVFAYTNDENLGWQQQLLTTVNSNTLVIIDCKVSAGKAYYSLDQGENWIAILDADLRWIKWFVGPYHGGNKPSPVRGIIYSKIELIK